MPTTPPLALRPSAERSGPTDGLDPAIERALDRDLARTLAPMYKMAFGVAVGTAAGLLFFLTTAARLLLDPAGRINLALLSEFFVGYSVSWPGAFIGLAWGFGVGFVAGWFAAFVRNLVLAVWLFVVRARADLASSREFLDHI